MGLCTYRLWRLAFLSQGLCALMLVPLFAEDVCTFLDAQGVIHSVQGSEKVPEEFRSAARCVTSKPRAAQASGALSPASPGYLPNGNSDRPSSFTLAGGETLAAPEEINLKGNIRSLSMSSSLGTIELRWPRKVEALFGRTPERAMADAARTASRALKQSGFSASLQNLNLKWRVVFMDEELPESQIPQALVSNCHPAWMIPPSNLYVASQRVVAGCDKKEQRMSASVADGELSHVLLHEMGHAIEAQLLQGGGVFERYRAEGFASWFEQLSADFSSVIPKGSVKARYRKLARDSFQHSPTSFNFTGSAEDYARAALFFEAVAERRGISDLMRVYETIRDTNGNFMDGVKKVTSWDYARIHQESLRLLEVR